MNMLMSLQPELAGVQHLHTINTQATSTAASSTAESNIQIDQFNIIHFVYSGGFKNNSWKLSCENTEKLLIFSPFC